MDDNSDTPDDKKAGSKADNDNTKDEEFNINEEPPIPRGFEQRNTDDTKFWEMVDRVYANKDENED